MTLKLVSNEDDRRFYLVDEMGRAWASPCTIHSQENHPGWSNKKTRAADLWAAIASDAEQTRAEFLIAAVDACQGMTVEQLRQSAAGTSEPGVQAKLPVELVELIRQAQSHMLRTPEADEVSVKLTQYLINAGA